jgi:hypothetical protein
MKKMIRVTVGCLLVSALLGWRIEAADTAPGFVDFGKFTPPAGGGEYVEVQISSNLISMAARLAEKAEPQVAELLRGLHQVRVNVIGLDNDNRAEMQKRIQKIRAELDTKGWDRVVIAQKKGEDIGVYIKTQGAEAVQGLAVTVIENDKEAVLVNIVGDIKPDKVALLGERLNIDPLKQVGESLKK